MILEEETYEKFGYYPSELRQKSTKRILAKCDECGKVRVLRNDQYSKLCMSCAHKRNNLSEETRRKLSNAMEGENHPFFGKPLSKEHGEKIAIANRCRVVLDETRRKHREAWLGEKNPNYGKPFTEEHKKNLCEARSNRSLEVDQRVSQILMGRELTEEHKIHIGESKRGEKHPNWQGGISFEPYCPKFDNNLKERVREFFGRKCFLCSKTEEENGKKLCVHHVNFDKMVCCNDTPPLFVPLCPSCHTKIHHNSEYWRDIIEKRLMSETNGKCFYMIEEMDLLRERENYLSEHHKH